MPEPAAPSGYHSLNAFIFVDGAEGLLTFLTASFGAVESERITRQDGRIGHAEARIGDSVIMVSDATDSLPPRPFSCYVFVGDVDAVYGQALAAGGTSLREPTDQFYGNREAGVVDPFGNLWWIATVLEDVGPSEVERRWRASQEGADA